MIKLIVLSVALNSSESPPMISPTLSSFSQEDTKIERSRRGKGQRGRKRGGNGLRQNGKRCEKNNGGNVSRMVI